MRFRSCEWRLAAIGLVVACASQLAAGQSNQEWIAIKQKCGIPAGTAYNDWVAAGSKCNSGSTGTGSGAGAEQLGTTLGNVTGDVMLKEFHNLLHGPPARLNPPIDLEQQQRSLAARQLNNSGIYLLNRQPRDYAGAINEFEKALQQTPNDPTITSNLQYARRLQKEAAVAGQTSTMLGTLLGGNSRVNESNFSGISPNVFNQVNLDPNVVDFRGRFRNSLPGTASSYLPAANANALNAILTGSDAEVVDLSGAARTSVDPNSLQTQIHGIFGTPAPAGEPQEIHRILQSPQATPSQPADGAKIKEIDNLLTKPDPSPHN